MVGTNLCMAPRDTSARDRIHLEKRYSYNYRIAIHPVVVFHADQCLEIEKRNIAVLSLKASGYCRLFVGSCTLAGQGYWLDIDDRSDARV